MKKYEAMFLVDQETANKKWDEIIGHIRTTLEKYKAEILDLDKWQDLKLAYPIKKRRKGTYIVAHFNLDPLKVAEVRHDFQLSDYVLRSLIISDTGKRQSVIEEPAPEEAAAPPRPPLPGAAVEEETIADEAEDIVTKEEKAD